MLKEGAALLALLIGPDKLIRLLKLAFLRAQGFSMHLRIPTTKNKIAACNNLLSPPGGHDFQNTYSLRFKI
jgi:hypothetical protein